MQSTISKKDREILRDLAKKQVELSNSSKMAKLRKDWEEHGSFKTSSRPMILIETGTFKDDIIPPLLKCEGKSALKLEEELLLETVNHTLYGDDTVVKDYISVKPHLTFIPFGIEVKSFFAKDSKGQTSLGHHFVSVLKDLEEDFFKLGKSTFGINKENTQKEIDLKNDIYGDILPVRLCGFSLYCCPTQDIVHIMKMEDMYTSMYDYPDLFHKMMSNLTNDYLEFFDFLESQNILQPTFNECHLAQGSYCYNDELPVQGTGLKTKDIWGYLDSQETSGVSSEMFAEFIIPYYKLISNRYGLLSYGCCEAVHPIWDNFLSDLKNLKKVSISPWCNEEYMGEKLFGKNIVYMRKPTPNLLGLGVELDENAVKEHIDKTVLAAKGCTLEIIQRDVYKIGSSPIKVKRYVDLIRSCCENHKK